MDGEKPSFGPYRLLEPLGRGSMGVVYRAEHAETGHHVALKTVPVRRVALLQSIRREIHAVSRLSHPGIVRVLATGVDDDPPWYAMELLEGVDLRTHWAASVEAAGRRVIHPQALRRLLRTVRCLCHGLAYLHGEGLVHRDLKPGNVIVQGDSRAVLVDFGLAARFAGADGREALHAAAEAGGTLAYMAPEQCRGLLVDARADLYSLGCILYELLTGRPPFVADHPVQLLRQHFEEQPRPASELADGIPDELDSLLLRLLEKDPRDRIGHADGVASILDSLGAQADDQEPASRPRPYLYRSGFVGRRDVMEKLRRRIEALQKGSGGFVLIGGESGAGKTRLAVELGREASRLKLQVLSGECLDTKTPMFGPFRETFRVIADRCREGGSDETLRLLGPSARLLTRYEPMLAKLPGHAELAEVAELPGTAGRLQLFLMLSRTLSALGQSKPALLLVDDLQWADELTIGFLEFLQRGRRLETMPLLVVGSYRTEQPPARLEELVRRCSATQVVLLERLDTDDVTEMAGEMLGVDRPREDFGRLLASSSEGNPFFVSEYLHAALAEELLYRDGLGRWQVAGLSKGRATRDAEASLPLPRSVRQLVERRLEGLPSRSRELVEATAVVGRQATIPLLERMLGLQMTDVFEASAEALRSHVLEEVEAEPPLFEAALRFRHDQLREVALERLGKDRRIKLHRAAAEAMETPGAGASDEDLAAIAEHWEAAEVRDRARGFYLTAAKRARARNLHGEAVRLYRGYLRLVEILDGDSLQARFDFLDSLRYFAASTSELLEEHEIALAEARSQEARHLEGLSLKLLARLYQVAGRRDEAVSAFEEALAVSRAAGDREVEGTTLDNYAAFLRLQGRMDEARELYEQALRIHRAQGNRANEGATRGNLAALLATQGRFDEARGLYEQALVIHRETGKLHWEGHVLTNLGLLHQQQGRLKEARSCYEQALANHRQVGDDEALFVRGCLAHLDCRQGHLVRAREEYERLLERLREYEDPVWEGRTLHSIGAVEHALGCLDEAQDRYEEALELQRRVPDPQMEGFLLADVATLRFDEGQLDAASRVFEEAIQRLRSVNIRSEEGNVLARLADVRLSQGLVGEARSLCSRAVQLARETGEPLNEALALTGAARIERLGGGDLNEAHRLAHDALARMRSVMERLELGPCLCEAGHVELAVGRPATRYLAEARRLAEDQELGPRSARMRAVERLARAQADFDAGKVLVRGARSEDVPAALVDLEQE